MNSKISKEEIQVRNDLEQHAIDCLLILVGLT